ncbi:Lsr2 family protein [Amycolatopsis sp. DSM 110486]|uniref:histone-like nucleoid-structuring protein Lsr2 n=1 Tax=Amycolatopsis sp. DSM 110486 TaxID=2865832 RepID=UPI001C69D387|nr:Lsr2 family protein [Amycolatopsis sp. DSM 110486]QYN16821.1 Lsr2 family protein [Amycolatopsis sp. DSM 110486]
MAKNTAVHVLDDLTGEPAAETVGFGLDGLDYEIDLSVRNAAALREIFDPYVTNGRRTGGRKQRPRLVAGAKAVEPQEVPAKAKPAKRIAAAAKTTARPVEQAEPAPKTTRAKQPVKNPAAEPKAVVKTTEPKPAKDVRRPVKKIPAVTFSAGE